MKICMTNPILPSISSLTWLISIAFKYLWGACVEAYGMCIKPMVYMYIRKPYDHARAPTTVSMLGAGPSPMHVCAIGGSCLLFCASSNAQFHAREQAE